MMLRPEPGEIGGEREQGMELKHTSVIKLAGAGDGRWEVEGEGRRIITSLFWLGQLGADDATNLSCIPAIPTFILNSRQISNYLLDTAS